jgi:hypothetical protein
MASNVCVRSNGLFGFGGVIVGGPTIGWSSINVDELERTSGVDVSDSGDRPDPPQKVHAPITSGWPQRGHRSARVKVGVGVSVIRCTVRC